MVYFVSLSASTIIARTDDGNLEGMWVSLTSVVELRLPPLCVDPETNASSIVCARVCACVWGGGERDECVNVGINFHHFNNSIRIIGPPSLWNDSSCLTHLSLAENRAP